ncbi:unnamed protein product [Chilo suppressalis]|uniref:FP protein C-terminal domain-containing protein n=1 Tax=Chilo suppressalis TaxID=168631 RepID=A0ABN8BF80_CHISP|nr:unnamed protein product [Chilo suppressalis]
MPNLARSPPSLLNQSLSMSEPDVNRMVATTAALEDSGLTHCKQRDSKRRRIAEEQVEPERADFRAIIREELRDFMNTMQIQQNSRLDIIEKYISEIKSQNDLIHSNNLDIEKSIEFLNHKLDELQNTINRLETERKQISSQIINIGDKCDTLERLSRKTSIQIRNVPKQKGETKEKLFEMIKKLSTTLTIEIEKTEIRDKYRIPAKTEGANSVIIAEFSSTLIKESILAAAKTHNLNSKKYKTEQLNSAHLGLEGHKEEIYLSEHLTAQASRLYFLARDFRKTMDYAYCWTSNGLVYLRKKQGAPYILVKNEAQLHQMKNM